MNSIFQDLIEFVSGLELKYTEALKDTGRYAIFPYEEEIVREARELLARLAEEQ